MYRKPISLTTTVLAERKRKAMPKTNVEIARPSTMAEQLQGDMVISEIANVASLSLRKVYRQQIINDLLVSAVPKSYHLRDNSGKKLQSSGWFGLLLSLPDITTALESSILAIAVARLGRLKKDPALVHESLKFYTKGLVDLQQALWNPKLMHRDETTAACMSLVMYEVIECPGQSVVGWQSHIRACTKMFELKGADSFTSDFGHEVFLSFRLIEVSKFGEFETLTDVELPRSNLHFQNDAPHISQTQYGLIAHGLVGRRAHFTNFWI